MAHPILMPKAGQSMTEGKIVTWLKKEGDAIEEGEPILEIETDKANLEVEATHAGVLREILAAEGETCPVLTLVGVVGEPGEAYDIEELKKEIPVAVEQDAGDDLDEPVAPVAGAPAPRAVAPAPAAPSGGSPAAAAAATLPASALGIGMASTPPAGTGGAAAGGKVAASPLARRIARQRGVDLAGIRGSGPGGRILRRDVEAAPAGGARAPTNGAATVLAAPARPYPPPSPRPPAAVPMEGMRKAIGTALQQSKQMIPHFYATVAIDVTAALALKRALQAQGTKVSINDLVVRACVLALTDEPRVNCRVSSDKIEYPEDINIGVAVGQEYGLVVPVIQKAQTRTLAAIAEESRRIVAAANAGKLIGSGKGTFTVSNLGMFGVESFTAIINPPEGAILAVGTVSTELVPSMGGILPRSILRVTLSSDHRAVDGVLAARFLQRLKHFLESPEKL